MTARARVGAVAVTLLAAAAVAAPARADSVSDKQREAQEIANRIEQLSSRAADLGEALNGAQARRPPDEAGVHAGGPQRLRRAGLRVRRPDHGPGRAAVRDVRDRRGGP